MALVTDVEAKPLAEGLTLSKLQPGGKDGPHGAVHADVPGGQVWTQVWTLGGPYDEFRMLVPDIRMPPNQYWPLHWHDSWIGIVVLDGSCLVGDWWMQPGDVLISAPSLEYGPVVNGPKGCQLFEIFAREIGALGGYAPEFHDHPTLHAAGTMTGAPPRFLPRPPGSERNAGHQALRIDGTPGLTKGRLGTGRRWDLGEPSHPDRGVMLDTLLRPGQGGPKGYYDDWRAVFVLDGSLVLGDWRLAKDDVVLIAPGARVPAFASGPEGAHLFEVARTAAGVERRS